jgi:hypothetical protein
MSPAPGGFGKRLAFFGLNSFGLATAGYFLLRAVLPGHRVFGSWYRMFDYHDQHPLPYIAVCCLSFSLLAACFALTIARQPLGRRLGSTTLLLVGTVLLSSPVGGMLWHLHDMQAGYFPVNWPTVLLAGAGEGLLIGWLIVLLSVPYNMLGVAVSYLLLQQGAARFRD